MFIAYYNLTMPVKLLRITTSTAPGKKYTAEFDLDGRKTKYVHFGAVGMDDYTITHDKAQRARYRSRHAKDLETFDPLSPGYLSYYILWGNSTDLQKNARAYKRFFLSKRPRWPRRAS